MFSFLGYSAFSQLAIKGYSIGGSVYCDDYFKREVTTTVMGQETTIYFKGKMANDLIGGSLNKLTIESFSFSLTEDRAKQLIAQLHKKYGGELRNEDSNWGGTSKVLVSKSTKVTQSGGGIKVERCNSRINLNDF